MTNIEMILELYPDMELLQADGFDDAIIGVDNQGRLVYSRPKAIEVLMKQGMDYLGAWQYFSFNLEEAYMGPKTPIWVEDDFKQQFEDSKKLPF